MLWVQIDKNEWGKIVGLVNALSWILRVIDAGSLCLVGLHGMWFGWGQISVGERDGLPLLGLVGFGLRMVVPVVLVVMMMLLVPF